MKMKKMIYFMFALLLLSANSMNAQVAIGTDPTLEPRPGTILDLRHVSANNLGLLLPKVTLTDAKIWAPVKETLGLLYTWAAASNRIGVSADESNKSDQTPVQGVCPNGWHLPSDYEVKR